jgi:NAD(P)-dependent dehydrogenase (short-subunit alcohol dehydrogenase family)
VHVELGLVAGLGGCDLVIANAGISHPSRILETPDELFEKVMRINYFGTVYTVRAFLPHLFAQRRGHIGITSSSLGFMGIYGYTAYAASKFAQVGFARVPAAGGVWSMGIGISCSTLRHRDAAARGGRTGSSRPNPGLRPARSSPRPRGGSPRSSSRASPAACATSCPARWASHLDGHARGPGLVNWVIDDALKKVPGRPALGVGRPPEPTLR